MEVVTGNRVLSKVTKRTEMSTQGDCIVRVSANCPSEKHCGLGKKRGPETLYL